MVGALINDVAPRAASVFCRVAIAALVALGAGASTAGELPDPTRPPLAQRRAAPAASQAAPAATPPVLQSILTGEGRKPAVIINGRALELGEAFDDMRLTRVTANGALLSGPRGVTALTLTPDSDKQLAAAPAPIETLAQARTPAPQRRNVAAALRTTETK